MRRGVLAAGLSALVFGAAVALSCAWGVAASDKHAGMMTGGVREGDSTDPHVKEAALFAVDQLNDGTHRDKLGSIAGLLNFVRVESVSQQVVAGMMYHMVLVVTDSDGSEHRVNAAVWSRPWLKSSNAQEAMQLTEVRLADEDNTDKKKKAKRATH